MGYTPSGPETYKSGRVVPYKTSSSPGYGAAPDDTNSGALAWHGARNRFELGTVWATPYGWEYRN
jgi:hypothetical protein